MKEILRTNDPVELSYLQMVLSGEGIETVVFDEHTSIMEGSIGTIPRRLMVLDEDESRARWVLETTRQENDDNG